ncbi:MAG: hypothetical protein MI861_16890 [Pirellulales bacterium]|nr:hypothetical protein [Pirellulales bacterium]
MSNVVIFVDGDSVPASELMKLQKATSRGLGEIRSAISAGTPIVEREIFEGNFEDHASLVREVLTVLEDGALKHRIYELPEGETMETFVVDRFLASNQ